jgi:hypothetical protein
MDWLAVTVIAGCGFVFLVAAGIIGLVIANRR